jgi:hypothetical protein
MTVKLIRKMLDDNFKPTSHRINNPDHPEYGKDTSWDCTGKPHWVDYRNPEVEIDGQLFSDFNDYYNLKLLLKALNVDIESVTIDARTHEIIGA